MVNSHGRFVWYELMTTDIETAKAFYANVMGWGTRDASMPGLAYSLFTIGDVPVAGLMNLPEDARRAGVTPHWIGYVGVDDVDAAVDRIKQLRRSGLRPADGRPQHQPLFDRRRPANGNACVGQGAETRPSAVRRSRDIGARGLA